MNIDQVKTLVLNTITKEYRNKAIMFFAVIIFFIIFIGNFSINFIYENFLVDGNAKAMIGDKGLVVLFAIISLVMTLISSILGINCIKSDFESTSISQILSLPIRRVEYVGSRIFGSWIIAVVSFIVAILFTALLLSSSNGVSLITPKLILATGTASLNMLTVITIAACLSLFVPKVFAFIFTFILRYMISSANIAYSYGQQSDGAGGITISEVVTAFFHFLFPRIAPMGNLTDSLITGSAIDFSVVALFGHYFVTYIFLFLFLNFLISRRDI